MYTFNKPYPHVNETPENYTASLFNQGVVIRLVAYLQQHANDPRDVVLLVPHEMSEVIASAHVELALKFFDRVSAPFVGRVHVCACDDAVRASFAAPPVLILADGTTLDDVRFPYSGVIDESYVAVSSASNPRGVT